MPNVRSRLSFSRMRAGDHVDVRLRLRHGNPRLQPHQDVVVLVARGCFTASAPNGSGRKTSTLSIGPSDGITSASSLKSALQDAGHGEWLPVERDALAHHPRVGVESRFHSRS